MDIEINEVQEIIKNLESVGEISIKEGKYLKVAKLCVQLAAENIALKATSDDRRMFIMNGVQLGYIKVPTVETDQALETIRIAVSPQETTPASDRIVAGIKADGVEEWVSSRGGRWNGTTEEALKFAKQLREGGQMSKANHSIAKALKMASRQTAFESAREEILADLQPAELALSAMDIEPVAEVVSIYGDPEDFGEREIRPLVGIQQMPYGTKLYRHAQPAPVYPEEMTPEQAYEIGDYHGDPVDVFARGANWMRQYIIDSTLAAGQQSPGSEPATVPGKWIPVSERMPLTPSADCEYSDIEVNVFDGERVFTAHYATGSQPHPWGYWVDTYAKITHWQPLPSAPQEDKP